MANCTAPMAATSNGVWQHDNPVDFSFPLLVVQVTLVVALTRSLAFIMRPLRQPRVIAEIIGGVLLGPTAMGRSHNFTAKIFPKQSITVLDTVANMGLLFFLFMVGLELDLRALRKVGGQALSIAAAGMLLPFSAGAGVAIVIHNTIAPDGKFAPFLVFMGVAMSITAFPVLARILAERKLLTTDVGQMAMSAAAVNDVTAWILLALAVALSGTDTKSTVAVWVLLCGVAFVIFMFVAVKPIMTWIASQSIENEPIKESYVCLTLVLVLVAGFCTDAIGIHLIFGGFVVGLIVPKDGTFAHSIIEKIEDFVSILLLPLYFASSGLKTNVASIHGLQSWGLLVLVIVVACFGKILGTVIVSQIFARNLRKSLTLGFLMNTKGLVELIVLNIGKDRGVLNDEVFAIMVLMALFTTFITTPTVMALYKPARNIIPYTRRTLHQTASLPQDELRILTCVHGINDVPAMINLTETARGQTRSTLRLYMLHLMELSERSSAIMMVQRARRDGRPFWDDTGAGRTDRIVVGFEAFGQLSKVALRPMTAISGYENIHEDICTTAEDKRAAVIILPFHKQIRFDGEFDTGHSDFRHVNRKVMDSAPCSVAILIDRGLWGASQISPKNIDHSAVVIFFGGCDDREALTFGLRMSEHPGVKLKVIRYTADLDLDATTSIIPRIPSSASGFSLSSARFSLHSNRYDLTLAEGDSRLQRQLDEAILSSVKDRRATSATPNNITYEEVEITDISDALQDVAKNNEYDLILTGRSRRPSPLLVALARRKHAEYSELGPVGDILISSQCHSSILVVQQYDPDLKRTPAAVADTKGSAADVEQGEVTVASQQHFGGAAILPSDSPV